MSVTVYFANVSKKRNSTLQGTFSTSYDCVLKAPTSLDRPTFLVEAATMDYNAAKMGDRYYFIDDVVSVRNGQWEVSCILDVLATYKAEILASTQYVTYSTNANKTWLVDTRIPILKSTSMSYTSKIPGVFLGGLNGFYSLTVNGKNGCVAYALSYAQIKQLINKIDQWAIDDADKVLSGVFDPNNPQSFSFNAVGDSIESLSTILTQAGALGNSYQNAPQMIRSCIWLPFDDSYFTIGGGSERLYLGDYDTGIDCGRIDTTPYTYSDTFDIPWTYSDWRRSVCENVYIVLPFAGVINLPSDSLTGVSSLSIEMAISPVDGGVAYSVKASNEVIGIYGGNCASNYAIGINQKSGLAEIAETLVEGVERMAAASIESSGSPLSIAGAIAGTALEGVAGAFEVKSVSISTHPSCIGTFSSSAAAFVSGNGAIEVYTVVHPTSINPSDMAATMGRPFMEPTSLSGLTGFCQCANAHVAAAAQARELDAIDAYLNSGFFIE